MKEKTETLQEKRRRYLDSEMCEVSDDEFWRHIHYGPPLEDEHDHQEGEQSESLQSDDPSVHLSALPPAMLQAMRETNSVLRTRIERLECEWDDAQIHNNSLLMAQLEGQIREAHAMMYSDVNET